MDLWTETPFLFQNAANGRKTMVTAPAPEPAPPPVPRVSRLMALALKLEKERRAGLFGSLAEIARAGRTTDAYITQVMNLVNLAPDIQEELLFLPPRERGHAPVKLATMQAIAAKKDWRKQRRLWASVKARINSSG